MGNSTIIYMPSSAPNGQITYIAKDYEEYKRLKWEQDKEELIGVAIAIGLVIIGFLLWGFISYWRDRNRYG